MEEETKMSSEIPVMKVVEDKADPIKETNGDLRLETGLDGEFIKVEKEALEVKEVSHAAGPPAVEDDDKPSAVASNSNREMLAANEKVKELEIEVERVSAALREEEAENARLKDEVLVTKQKFEERVNKCEELEIGQKKLQEQIVEAEEKYSSELNACREALQAEEAKHKELAVVKEALDSLSLEIEKSRRRMQELEHELQCSVDEAKKFEELHKQSGAQAESETQRALELERLLEAANASANEMTGQMDALQEDLKGLSEKNSESKEDLRLKISELEDIKLKLQEEVNARDSVEAVLKTQEVQVSTISEQLDKVTKEKEVLEAAMADLTSNMAQVKELSSELEEKLRNSDENLCKTDSLLSQALANNSELEQKLKSLEEQHNETGAAAATATQKYLELEVIVGASNDAVEEAKSKLRELETQYTAVEQRKLELEQQRDFVELKSRDAEREVREFSEKVSQLSSTLKEYEEEKEQLNNQMNDYQDKITQLESSLNQSNRRSSELEEELRIAKDRSAKHEDRASMSHQCSIVLEDLFQTSHSKLEEAGKRVNELEMFLEAEKYRIQELEEHISTLEKRCEEAETGSNQNSDKATEFAKELETLQARASGFEVALEMANDKERELSESLTAAADEKKKLKGTSNGYCEKLGEAENLLALLRDDLNMTQARLESVENDLKAAGLRESEVVEKLKYAEEQLRQQSEVLEQATSKNSELESLHESLSRDSEIKLQEALTNATNRDLEAKSLLEKVKTLEDQVKMYEEQLAEETGKSALLKEELDSFFMKVTSLESTNEELQRQVVVAEDEATNASSENELLVETNNQLKIKVAELQELVNSAISEKEVTAQQLASHMNTVMELTEQRSRALELHSATETQLKEAETHLHEAIQRFTHRDIEANDLNEKVNVVESQIKLYEEQVREASKGAECHKVELEETLWKLKNLESIIDELQTRSDHFERESGGLAETNLKLTQDLAMYEIKLSYLQAKLSATDAESNKTVEKLTSEVQGLQSQISSVMEENNSLKETCQNAENGLHSLALQLEEHLKEKSRIKDTLMSEMEVRKAETSEKSVLETRVKELEELLVNVETQLKEEIENVKAAAAGKEAEFCSKLEDQAHKANDKNALAEQVLQLQSELHFAQTAMAEQRDAASQKRSAEEANLRSSLVDLENKNKEVALLQNKVEDLEQKLQQAQAKLRAGADAKMKGTAEIKSRDIGSPISTPSKRKSKKKLGAAAQTSSSTGIHTQHARVGVSPMMSAKFITGIALVSLIIGIILVNRY